MKITKEKYIEQIAGPKASTLNLDKLRKGSYYLSHKIKKRKGGYRKIFAPQSPLIDVQNHLLHNFFYNFKVHENAYGFVKNRSPALAAKKHIGAEVILTVDLKNYFPNIDHKRVKNLIHKLIVRDTKIKNIQVENIWHVAFLLTNICCLNYSLPQGAPTSPAIANLVTFGLDIRLKKYCEKLGYTYTRYADDIAISSKKEDDFIEVDPILTLIHTSGFIVNKKKVKIRRKHQRLSVTGIVVNEKLSVPRWKWRNFKAKLHNLQVNNVTISKKKYQQLKGYCTWIHSLHPKRGEKLLKKLGKITVKGN